MTDHVTAEERAKRLEKIRKCLRLAGSPNPNEAAAAMRRAKKMMEQLGVTAEEVEAPDIGEAEIKTREGYGNCRYMNLLTTLITDLFGVRVVYFSNPGSANRLNVRYFGPQGRVQLAEYTHRVLQRSLEAAWAEFLDRQPWHKASGKRQAFYMGWLWAVRPQVTKLVPSDREELATSRFIELRYGGLVTLESRKRTELDRHALAQGRLAAAEFSISIPLEEDQLKLGYASE